MSGDLAVVGVGEDLHGPTELGGETNRTKRKKERRRVRTGRPANEISR